MRVEPKREPSQSVHIQVALCFDVAVLFMPPVASASF